MWPKRDQGERHMGMGMGMDRGGAILFMGDRKVIILRGLVLAEDIMKEGGVTSIKVLQAIVQGDPERAIDLHIV